MKKIKFILLGLFGISMLFYSCNDAINITQPGLLDAENAFQNVNDLNQGLLAVYGFLDNTREIRINAYCTDEISIGFDNGGQGLDEYQLVINPSMGAVESIWINKYYALRNVNNLIHAAEEVVSPEEGEEAEYNNILGQAYAIRAYLHFELLTYFSTDLTDDSALGIPIADHTLATSEQVPRSTNAEVYDFINSDLTKANNLIADDNGVTFIGKDFIKAMHARINVYRGKYDEAEPYCDDLLASYSLANTTEFYDIFQDLSNAEIIFKLERNTGDRYNGQGTSGGGWAGSLFAFVNSTLSGSPFMEMSRSLFNQLDPNDVRYTTYVDPSSIIDPNYQNSDDPSESDKLVIRKYPGSDGQPLMNDLKIFRIAEILLLKAECRAHAGDYNGVASLLDQLQDARMGSDVAAPSISSETEAYKAILDARRIELAFEGFRWVDIKRLGIKAGASIDRDPVDCNPYGVCGMPADDHRFTLPIPLQEMDQNSAMVQNPGY